MDCAGREHRGPAAGRRSGARTARLADYAGAWCGHGLSLAVDSAWRFGRTVGGSAADSTLPWTRLRGLALPKPALEAGTRAYLRMLDLADRHDLRTGSPKSREDVPGRVAPAEEGVFS